MMAATTIGSAAESITTQSTSQSTSLNWLPTRLTFMLMLMPLIFIVLAPAAASAHSVDIDLEMTDDEYELDDYLHTETVLIDTLRQYIEALEQKITLIKRKTLEIKTINDEALLDMHKYVNNPLNALTIIKRFTTDWQQLRQYARNNDSTTEIVRNLGAGRKSLKFPSESDFDAAAGNLLRIQDIYQLEPQRLAVGEVNGIKLGSEMSWSDCLEIGRISIRHGDFMLAKFWMETALGKLPAAGVNGTDETQPATTPLGESTKARFEIWEALLSTEFNMGNIDNALDIANKMLQQHPQHARVLEAKSTIENELLAQAKQKDPDAAVASNDKTKRYKKQKKKSDKSVEELLIEEICRESANAKTDGASSITTTSGSANIQRHCALERANLPQLLLQPLQVEYLSLDPYIVIQHNVLRAKELAALQQLVDETDDEEAPDDADVVEDFKFTKIGQKKLKHIAKRLQLLTGHSYDQFDAWKVDRWTFEDDIDATEPLLPRVTSSTANVLFNLQQPKLSGGIVFPQLELSVKLPEQAVLYWTNLNEYREYDYRTTQHVCPVIAGTQIAAYTSIRS